MIREHKKTQEETREDKKGLDKKRKNKRRQEMTREDKVINKLQHHHLRPSIPGEHSSLQPFGLVQQHVQSGEYPENHAHEAVVLDGSAVGTGGEKNM